MNKEKLFKRNKKIIDVIINQIENNCPGTIDLIGISGSFCSGNFYEKSDLDLVIVSNDIAKSNILSKCFILDGIGYDIYLSDWNRFEKNCFQIIIISYIMLLILIVNFYHLELWRMLKDFFIDLLFYHIKLKCYVAVELKAVEEEDGEEDE